MAFVAILAILLSVAVVILLIVANWKIFVKADEKGWKSLIPIYNAYVLFRIAWKTSMFWICLVISVLGGFMMLLRGFWMFVGWGCSIAELVLIIMLLYRLAKSFGHGVGYTLGLIFLPNVFTLILAFGSDEYEGAQD